MLFVGDVFQLEPVVTRDEQDILSRFWETPHFFSARVFKEMQLVSIELTKVYRQSDNAFISVLDHIRTNNLASHDLELLNTCVDQDVSGENGMFVTLATRRDVVDSINQTNLNNLEGDPIHFKGEIRGEFPESSLPTLLDLELKVGAQIIFIKNDQDKRWVNGTIGTITGIDLETGDHLYILTKGGPGNASNMLLFYVYQKAFDQTNYGMASAITVVVIVVLLIVTCVQFFTQDKRTFYS